VGPPMLLLCCLALFRAPAERGEALRR